MLRRERLDDSHVNEWRAAIEASTLGTMTKKKSGSRQCSAMQQRIAALEKQVSKLESESARKDQVIAVRKTALEVLGKGVSFLEALSKKQSPRHERSSVPGKPKTSTSWSCWWVSRWSARWWAGPGPHIIDRLTPNHGGMPHRHRWFHTLRTCSQPHRELRLT